jgi:RNA polymerase sigma factor (sigma-70 family)
VVATGTDSDFDSPAGKFGAYVSAEEAEAALAATAEFNEKLTAKGYFVFAGGLRSVCSATVVDGCGVKPVFTDGPYLETKEWIGGFWVIDAPNLDVALELAVEGSKACVAELRYARSQVDHQRMIEDVFRDEWPRLVASLARRFGDLDIAEEAASEAVLTAVTAWRDATPPNPGGWLMTTATRKAIDRLRRESRREAKHAEALILQPDPEPAHPIEDDRLGLIFACCHPALAPEVQLALTLRLVAGLTVGEIARAFLSSEAAIGQRITRAKAKIKAAHIPLVVPERLEQRLPSVLAVVYLVFNEGYLPGNGTELRVDLSDEAIRLARLLHGLLPD